MANIKSAKKRILVNETKAARNKAIKSKVKTYVKKVETENGARTMKRPVGTYITVEAPEMAVPDEDYHREISEKLKSLLTRFVQVDKEDYSVLVVGLGNKSS